MKQKHRFLLIFNLCFALFAWGQKFQPNPLYGSTFNRGIYFFGLGVPQDTATLDNVQKLYPHIARIGDNTFFWSVVLQKWVPEVAGAGTETDPIYSANGVPKTRQITINGFTQDLTSDPNFTIPITLTETDPLYTANGVPKTRQVIINGMHQDLTADANFTIPIPPNIVLSGDATGTSTSVGSLPVTLANTVTAGSCTGCSVTYDSKGRITAASSVGYILNQFSSVQTGNAWYNGTLNLGGSVFRPDYKLYLESSSSKLLRLSATGSTVSTLGFANTTDTAGSISYSGISMLVNTQGSTRMTINSAATVITGDIQGSNQIRVGTSIGNSYQLSIGGTSALSGKIFTGASGGLGVFDASGTNITGTALHISGGKSTGSANGGDIGLYTTPAGTTGSTVNTESLRASILGASGNFVLNGGTLVLSVLATDPTGGSNGAMYYNSTTNKIRKYVSGAWVDLVSTSDAILNQTGSHQTGSFDITGTATIQGGATIGTTGVSSNTTINMSSNGIFNITQTNGSVVVNNAMTSALVRGQQSWEYGTNVQGRIGVQGLQAYNAYSSSIGSVTGYAFGTMIGNTVGATGVWTGASFGASFLFDNQTSASNPNAIILQYSNGSTIPVIFKKDGTTVLQKLTQTQPTATTAAATTTIDLATGNIFQINLAASITTLTLNNATPGMYYFQFTQDATGSRTVAWPANFKWAGGTAPTLTTTANKTDYIECLYNGTNFLASSRLNY